MLETFVVAVVEAAKGVKLSQKDALLELLELPPVFGAHYWAEVSLTDSACC